MFIQECPDGPDALFEIDDANEHLEAVRQIHALIPDLSFLLIGSPEDEVLQVEVVQGKSVQCCVVAIPFPVRIDLLRGGVVLPGKMLKDCKVLSLKPGILKLRYAVTGEIFPE